MSSIVRFVVTLLVFSVTASYARNSEVRLSQKSVKRSLMRYAPRVYGIKFNQCQASVKSLGRSESLSNSTTRTFPGGGFPNDEASNYLSIGPGSDRWLTFVTNIISFDMIDATSIKIDSTNRKGLVNMTILALPGKKGIFLRAGKDRKDLSSITFQVKASKADEVAGALVKLADACR